MTVNRVLSIVLGVAVVFAVYLWWPTDEARVKSRLSALGAALSAPAHEQELGRVARLAQIRSFLAEDIHVRVADQDITPRDMLLAFVSRWTPPPAGALVELSVDRLTFDANGAARMHVTMNVTARDGAERDRDTRNADVVMAKRNGDWVITNAETEDPVR